MTNRADFFQSDYEALAIPAGKVCVFVDGVICPNLQAAEIVRAGGGEFGWARLVYNPANTGDEKIVMPEDIESLAEIGQSISIRQIFDSGIGWSDASAVAVFNGCVASVESFSGEGKEYGHVIVRDFSARLKRISVHGRRVGASNSSSLFLSGLDTIFNPNGRPNAYLSEIEIEGDSYTVFGSDYRVDKFWTYAQVIDYLLREYLPAGQLQLSDIGVLNSLGLGQAVRDLDLTGLNLLSALERCCERIGVRFKFVSSLSASVPTEAIVFYRLGQGRKVELDSQYAGESLNISKTSAVSIRRKKEQSPLVHRYIGRGDFKIFEASFELVGAWDSAFETGGYSDYSPTSNPDFDQMKDVWRKWCLNEAGDYSGVPFNRGDAFDFSKIFGTSNFSQSRRRFWPAISCDSHRRSLGYRLEVSYVDGAHWWPYKFSFNNLLDECGIWLSDDQLDLNTWVAAIKGMLKFRITASVISDERLSCEVSTASVDSTADVVEHIVTLPRKFKYRKVTDKSIYAFSQDPAIGEADQADDSAELVSFIRQMADDAHGNFETVDIQTPYLALNYDAGDVVTQSGDSRGAIVNKFDGRSFSMIERVHMDIVNQRTKIKLQNYRK